MTGSKTPDSRTSRIQKIRDSPGGPEVKTQCLLPMQGVQVQFLVWELRSLMPQNVVKTNYRKSENIVNPGLDPGDLPDPGIKQASFLSPALAGRFFTTSATREAPSQIPLVSAKNNT